MKRKPALCLVITIFAACRTLAPVARSSSAPVYALQHPPLLGVPYPDGCKTSGERLMAGSSQIWPICRVTNGGVEYSVGVDQDGKGRYVETSQGDFITPEGLRVGSSVNQVVAAGGSKPMEEPGWAYYSALLSGWNAMYGIQSKDEMPADAKVILFFKRE